MTSFGRRTHKEKVWLNVYDLNPNNDALIWLGLGAFHSGVEVHGVEWTFGSSSGAAGSGVFSHAPKAAPGVPLRASLLLGEVQASAREVESLVASLKGDWPGRGYSLIRCNCNHFADELVLRLLGKRIPGWVNRLSYVGERLSCLLPQSLLGGGAPVNGSGDGSGGGGGDGSDDEDGEGSASSSSAYRMYAPRGARAGGGGGGGSGTSSSGGARLSSGVAFSGAGHTLGGGGATATTAAAAAPTASGGRGSSSSGASAGGRTSSMLSAVGIGSALQPQSTGVATAVAQQSAAARANRDTLVAAAMRRLQAQAVAQSAASTAAAPAAAAAGGSAGGDDDTAGLLRPSSSTAAAAASAAGGRGR